MSFDTAFAMVIGAEGGYSNDPKDPGGETNFGISKKAYPNLDIRALTLDQARDIYFADYWVPAGCGYIADDAMAAIMFDTAVNMGVFAAKSIAATTTGQVEFLAERALRYTKMKTFDRFGKGWVRRLFSLAIEANKSR